MPSGTSSLSVSGRRYEKPSQNRKFGESLFKQGPSARTHHSDTSSVIVFRGREVYVLDDQFLQASREISLSSAMARMQS